MFYHYKDTRLYYEVVGEGKPVLLLHGLACDMNLMKGCMEPVFKNRSGYKRIYVDLPGMGQSDAHFDFATADKIIEVLSAFSEERIEENFLLVGESYGGYLCRGLLGRQLDRVDGFMLICPVVVPQAKIRQLPEKNLMFGDEDHLNTLKESSRAAFCEYAVIADERTYRRHRQEIVVGLKRANYEFIDELRKNYHFEEDFNGSIRNKTFHNPTLFVCGRQDNCVGYRDLWTLLEDYPRATFGVLDVAGHNMQIEQPELFESLTKNWLDRVETFKKGDVL